MLRALFCVLAAFFRAAAALRQVLIFHKIQNLEDDHMGFHYAREKKKFDAEWAKTAAWYKAEGMPDEDIEAMRRFDWAEFCSRRAYETGHSRCRRKPSRRILPARCFRNLSS